MRRVVWCAGLAAALLAADAGLARAQALFTAAQDPVAGARLFTEKRCGDCHAINGKGGTLGPDLARVTRPRTFYDLAAGLWNHAPEMASRMRVLGIQRPQLNARESGNIAAYLFTLSYFDRPGDADAGRRLFAGKRCVVCHEVGGIGGGVGPRLDAFRGDGSPIALAAAMWSHGPDMIAAMEAKGIERPRFSGGEMLDLMAYIERASAGGAGRKLYVLPGRAAEGRRLFNDRRCAECHAAGGKVDGKIDLAEREANKSVAEFVAAMWNKLPVMSQAMRARGVPFRPLRAEEMADVVAFLYSVRYFAEAGDPRNGVILATYKGCLGCHGLYGERGKPASDLTASRKLGAPADVMSALWNHAFIADPRPARDAAPWPRFTGREMADLIAYLRSLRRAP